MSRFSYVRYDKTIAALQAHFKNDFEHLEGLANEELPNGRWKSLFMTKIEEAYMCVGKALRDMQIEKDGKVIEEPHRGEEPHRSRKPWMEFK